MDFFNLVERYDSIVIFGHVYPDGDCYGSEVGLREALKYLYPRKKIYAVGSGFAKRPADFPGMDEVSDETIAESLAVIVDLSTLDRLEDKRAEKAKEIAKIDHHVLQQHFGTVEIVREDFVSCSLIIADMLLNRFGEIPKEAAGPLLLGFITDSGRFLYQPMDATALRTVAALLDAGASLKEIYDVLNVVEEKSLRFKGYIYLNYQRLGEIAYMTLDRETLRKFGYSHNEAAGFVNAIANISGFKCWVFFAESEDGTVRTELRSSGHPVQPTALRFGGGGHRCAAGCTLARLSDYEAVLADLAKSLETGEGE